MAKQLNVNLKVGADTTQAKAAFQDLQNTLQNLTRSSSSINSKLPLTKEIQEATIAADQLRLNLEKAVNTDTGKINLAKFQQQMNQSGMSIEKYGAALSKLGPQGQQAFAQLARSLVSANVSFANSNTLVNKLWTTLKNTARWQISSSALKALYSGLSTAYRYAQDLNESLNNIRIVTGQSADQMARFATVANQSARELSTSTNEYLKASLIYYQQGLSDDEVKARTDITVKMANVSRQSAQNVSDQMTAIWNNFAKGSENLEHYADAITALGAATASSSDEIAQGMSKFAAVADTVGLSYDKAAAAVATVIAETRQSADIVGTAFKTIFARIESLKLGETLEDGVSLNKYSQALKTIGVDILDQNNNLKQMDDILDDLGSKWVNLTEAQKVAVSETIAGTRQYAQFMALMENYDKIQQNQQLATKSDGTLQGQADIYAESWEAARKRVQASAEAIYAALLDDKTFIKFSNSLADVLNTIKNVIDGLGGFRGVLAAIGSLALLIFRDQIANALDNLILKTTTLFTSAEKKIQKQKDMVASAINEMYKMGQIDTSKGAASIKNQGMAQEMQFAAGVYKDLGSLQIDYLSRVNSMTEAEKERYQILLNIQETMADELVLLEKQAIQSKENAQNTENSLQRQLSLAQRRQSQTEGKNATEINIDVKSKLAEFQQLTAEMKKWSAFSNDAKKLDAVLDSIDITPLQSQLTNLKNIKDQGDSSGLNSIIQEMTNYQTKLKEVGVDTSNLESIMEKFGSRMSQGHWEVATQLLQQYIDELMMTPGSYELLIQKQEELTNLLTDAGVKNAAQLVEEYAKALEKAGGDAEKVAAATERFQEGIKKSSFSLQQSTTQTMSLGQAITRAGSALMAVNQIISSISGVIDVFNDDTKTAGDRFKALIGAVAMLVPAMMSLINAFTVGKVAVEIFGTTLQLSLGWISLLLMAITALIFVIVELVKAGQKNSLEGQLKAAKEEAQKFKEALDEAKTAADNLKASIDKYTEAKTKLEACIKGTKEWEQALRDTNDAAREILSSIHGMSAEEIQSLYNVEDGYIQFSKNALDTLQERANKLVADIQLALDWTNFDIENKQIELNLRNSIKNNSENIDIWRNNGTAQKLGAAEVAQILMDNLDTLSSVAPEELAKVLEEKFDIFIDYENIEDYNRFYRELEKTISQLANTVDATNEKFKTLIGIDLQNTLTGDAATDPAVLGYVTGEVEKYIELNLNNIKESLTSATNENFSLDEGLKYLNILSEVAGQNLQFKNKSGDMYNFVGIDGKTEFSWTEDYIAKFIAAKEALEKIGDSAQASASTVSKLDDATKALLADDDFSNAKISDIKKLNDEFKKSGLSAEEFLKKAKGFSDEAAAAYADSFEKSLQIIDEIDIDKENSKFKAKIQKVFGTDISEAVENMTAGQAKALVEGYEKIGKLGNSALKEALDQIIASAKQEDLPKILEALSRVNPSSAEDWEEFGITLESLGINIDGTGMTIQELIAALIYANNATHSLTDALGDYAEQSKIISKLKLGDTISSEDYKKLSAEMKEFFTVTADGTYQLIKSAEELQTVLKNQAVENSFQNIRNQILDIHNAYKRWQEETGAAEAGAKAIRDFRVNNPTQAAIPRSAGEEVEQHVNNANTAKNAYYDTIQNVGEIEFNKLLSLSETLPELLANYSSLKELIHETGTEFLFAKDLTNAYLDNLTRLATQYENCTEELNALTEARRNGNEKLIEERANALALAEAAGELANKYGLNAEELEDLTEYFQQINEQLAETNEDFVATTEAAVQAATRYVRLNKAVQDLASNYGKYQDVLKELSNAQNEAEEIQALYTDDAIKLKETLANLLNTTTKYTNNKDFLKALDPKDLQDAANGSEDAINRIRNAFIDAQAAAHGLSDTKGEISAFKDALANLSEGEVIDIDNYPFLQKLIEAELAAGATATNIEELLSGFNIDANVEPILGDLEAVKAEVANTSDAVVEGLSYDAEVTEQDNTDTDKTEFVSFTEELTPHEADFHGTTLENTMSQEQPYNLKIWTFDKTVTPEVEPQETETQKTTHAVKISNAHKSAGGKINSKNVGGGSKGSGGGGGGGKSGSQEKAKPHKTMSNKKEPPERYHSIVKQIEDLTKAYDKANKTKDRLFGVDRLKAIEAEIKLTEQLTKKQKAYLAEINKNLTKDTQELLNGKKGAYEYTTKDADGNEYLHKGDALGIKQLLGIDVEFDKNGVITNYDVIVNKLNDWYAAQANAYNAMSGDAQEAADNNGLQDKINGQYDAIMDMLNQYEETVELRQEQLEEIRAQYRQIQDLKLEKLQYQIEIQVEVKEADIKRLELIRKGLEDNVWKSVEYLSLLFNKEEGILSTYSELIGKGNVYTESLEKLFNATHGDVKIDELTGEILEMPEYSDSAWLEELGDLEDGLYDVVDAFYELDDEIVEFYETTLSGFRDELDAITEKIADNISVLEHYQSLSALFGKEANYNWMGKILSGLNGLKEVDYNRAKNEYLMANAEYEKKKKEYEDAIARGKESEDTLAKRKAEMEAAETWWRESRDNMLSIAEEYAQSIVDIYENTLNKINKAFEDFATNGIGFDALNNSMERLSAIQDMVLTKTNQIYETNTLIRKLAQDIDKTNNISAKNKLANFQKEIKALQQQNQMTKFDLDVAKARYELLLAQIALEEARNARSTVRLQRDNEGNYGYVYTADQDKINDAEQTVADKQNDLYNLVLDKANSTTETLLKLDQEYMSARDEIARNTLLSDEEKKQQLQQLEEDYAKKREILLQDHNTSLYWLNEIASTGIEEAWSSTYENLIKDSEDWKEYITSDLNAVMSAMQDKTDSLSLLEQDIEEIFGDITAAIQTTEEETINLGEVFEKTLNQAAEELAQVSAQTSAYYTQRDAMKNLIQQYIDWITKIDEARKSLLDLSNTVTQFNQDLSETPNPTYGTENVWDYPSGGGSYQTGNGAESPSGSENPGSSGGKTVYGPGNEQPGSSLDTWKVFYITRPNGGTAYTYKGNSESNARRAFGNAVANCRNGSDKYSAVSLTKNDKIIQIEYIKNLDPSKKYDTGGYTGNWIGGSDKFNGKLAMLHEKELVLNAEDTKNFLDAVHIVRSISQAIDLRAAAQSGVAGLLRSPYISGDNSQSLEQMVTIHAEFPNAIDHYEIEEAFNNLVNRASQYAGRF